MAGSPPFKGESCLRSRLRGVCVPSRIGNPSPSFRLRRKSTSPRRARQTGGRGRPPLRRYALFRQIRRGRLWPEPRSGFVAVFYSVSSDKRCHKSLTIGCMSPRRPAGSPPFKGESCLRSRLRGSYTPTFVRLPLRPQSGHLSLPGGRGRRERRYALFFV